MDDSKLNAISPLKISDEYVMYVAMNILKFNYIWYKALYDIFADIVNTDMSKAILECTRLIKTSSYVMLNYQTFIEYLYSIKQNKTLRDAIKSPIIGILVETKLITSPIDFKPYLVTHGQKSIIRDTFPKLQKTYRVIYDTVLYVEPIIFISDKYSLGTDGLMIVAHVDFPYRDKVSAGFDFNREKISANTIAYSNFSNFISSILNYYNLNVGYIITTNISKNKETEMVFNFPNYKLTLTLTNLIDGKYNTIILDKQIITHGEVEYINKDTFAATDDIVDKFKSQYEMSKTIYYAMTNLNMIYRIKGVEHKYACYIHHELTETGVLSMVLYKHVVKFKA
jgi:hypothetical protein